MFRPLIQSARCALRSAAPIARPLTVRVQPQRFAPAFVAVRGYAAGSGMSKPEVEGRIMDLLKGFDKVCGIRRNTSMWEEHDADMLLGQGHLQGMIPFEHSTEWSLPKMPLAIATIALLERPRIGQLGHRGGCYGN